ncbi:lipoate--protein ligase family protein [Pseudoduganella namucuonensis]|uniref:Lipoate-protein ligase A n=1 Tax=Pseudoduganella namucuonensis TaxID=1035707 RepID=A0A1I7LX23_9BURK|nr:hypothetical protein [Pseudoduganella namucuonensis]SFV14219.1 lipoate-protein ligase A [Pseudoduganella namucuonensis]
MFAPLWNAPRQPVLATCHDEQAWNARQLAGPADGPAMQLWRYDAPAVVLGCSQRALLAGGTAGGIDLVLRQAGGGAVLTGPWMLSASVLLPHGHPLASEQLVHSYRWLGELYAGVLRSLGIAAHAITPDEARALQRDAGERLAWACYGGYSPWEVVVGRRKIVGLAQVRRRGGVLLVAGLQLARPDWLLLTRALGRPDSEAAALAACNTSCEEEAGGEDWLDAVAAPLRRALSYALFELAPEPSGAEIY